MIDWPLPVLGFVGLVVAVHLSSVLEQKKVAEFSERSRSLARREEGEYLAVFNRRATQPGGETAAEFGDGLLFQDTR